MINVIPKFKLNEYYIVFINYCQDSKCILKEQIVKLTDFQNLTKKYTYYYGLEGFHEGTVLENNIRELTNEETRLLKTNDWYSLPRDFYDVQPFT